MEIKISRSVLNSLPTSAAVEITLVQEKYITLSIPQRKTGKARAYFRRVDALEDAVRGSSLLPAEGPELLVHLPPDLRRSHACTVHNLSTFPLPFGRILARTGNTAFSLSWVVSSPSAASRRLRSGTRLRAQSF